MIARPDLFILIERLRTESIPTSFGIQLACTWIDLSIQQDGLTFSDFGTDKKEIQEFWNRGREMAKQEFTKRLNLFFGLDPQDQLQAV